MSKRTRWGKRTTLTERERLEERVSRRFRHHVRTKWNPRGRIHREDCVLSVAGECGPSEFHHTSYDHPFRGIWVCAKHHRDIDLRKMKIKARWITDYSSLVANIERRGGHAENKPERRPRQPAESSGNDCPF